MTNKNKEPKTLKIVGAAVALVLLVASIGVLLYPVEELPQQTNDELAQALTDDGWILYTTTTCSVCTDQKAVFGDAIDKLEIVECDTSQSNYDMCMMLNISVVPVWINERTRVMMPGYQSLNQMREIADTAEIVALEE